jgi:gliding motility-associated-like protein
MKNIFKSIVSFLTIFTIGSFSANATHVAGADITYQNVGTDSFLVTINIFDDCGGIANVGASITVDFTNTCGLFSFSENFDQLSETEVSQLCPAEQPNSTCQGGNLPGMIQRVYQKIVVLDSCNAWTITWGIGNRNASINLDPPGNTYYFAVTAELNSADAPTNNSPVFNSQPIPYVCVNQQVNYSFGVSELDGDSLVYSFADPLGGGPGAITVLTYQPGYTVLQPLPGIILDPVTGLLVFTPTIIGGFVVVVKVEEYANGILIGHVKRDIQFIVRPCTNIPPDLLAGEITNLTGNAVQTGPFAIEMCEGNTFSFTAVYTDVDVADTLQLTSNISTVLPGSNVSISGTNPLTANISWTAPAGSSGQNSIFSVNIDDAACPIPGIQTFVYNIDVVPSTFIIPSAAILCGNDSVQLESIGGSDFIWYDLSGTQIVPGPEFSCNNCPNPIVKPAVTTSYVVISNLSSTCINTDTIVVSIVPDYTINALVSDSIVCAGEIVQFDVQTTAAGLPYTFNWLPANLFSNPIAQNPTATLSNPGTISAIINVTSIQGCVRRDTISVVVVPAPIFSIQQYGPYCSNAPIVDLQYTIANPNYTENWVGQGITNTQIGTFDPSVAGVGTHSISLTLSVPGGTCTASQSISITVQTTPDASLTITDSIFCSTDAAVTLGTVTPGGVWSSNPPGLITTGLFNPSSSPIDTINLIYTFSGGCSDADTIQVIVNQTPQPPVLAQNQINCTGVNLAPGAVTANGVQGGTISWYLNPTLQGLINVGNTFEGEFNASGTVYAYDSINGCVSSLSSVPVNFYPTPTASFSVDPSNGQGITPFLVNFANQSAGAPNWFWNFGDSTPPDSANFNTSHTYTKGGIFRVLLTVYNSFGCTDTAGFTIIALEEDIIPNIFTPNGDGSNDEFFFKIDPNSISAFKATIYDRWGLRVVEFSNVKDTWDGGNYPAGTYYYTIEATDLNKQPFKYTHGFFKMMK